jgi:hypothetical protein
MKVCNRELKAMGKPNSRPLLVGSHVNPWLIHQRERGNGGKFPRKNSQATILIPTGTRMSRLTFHIAADPR